MNQRLYDEKPSSYYEIVRNDLMGFIPPHSKRVLDVGCGNGATAAHIKKRFDIQEVVGVEFFSAAASVAEKRIDRVLVGDIEELELPFDPGYFDCILCADVLEHTKDPWIVLRKLGRHLHPCGVLIASIPNLRHLVPLLKILFDRFEYEGSGVLDRSHLRFFTLHTIRTMFQDTGYTITQVGANRSVSWKFKLLNVCSLGLLRPFSVYQYIVVAEKDYRCANNMNELPGIE